MESAKIPLLVHGEVVDPDVDVFDREAVFIERILAPLVRRRPGLKIVLEHVTTEEGISFVRGTGPNVAATLTAHHLLITGMPCSKVASGPTCIACRSPSASAIGRLSSWPRRPEIRNSSWAPIARRISSI